MKATDRELLDISKELTAYIMKPITSDLRLDLEQCIILNGLISEEFERREEQDVMGSSNGQDPSLGQTGADNNDGNINASERRDNEASGTSLREKKKPQITKVSKKEYWDNRDKHGVYYIYDMSDEPESHFGKEPYKEPEVPYLGFTPYPDEHIPVAWMHEKVQQNFMLKSLFYSILSDWDFDADKYEAKGMNLVLYPKWLYIPLPYIVEKAKDPISNSRYRAIIQFWKQDRYMWMEYRPEPKPYTTKVFNTDKVNRNGTLYDFDTNDFLEQSKKIAEKGEGDKKYPAPPKSDTTITRPVQKVEVNTNETSDYPVGSFGYERERLANEVEDILEKNGINPNETTDISLESLDLGESTFGESTKVNLGDNIDETKLVLNGTSFLDKYIPMDWLVYRLNGAIQRGDKDAERIYDHVFCQWNSDKELYSREKSVGTITIYVQNTDTPTQP